MAFEPGRYINEQRKARRVRFRKSVFAKTLYLVEYLPCETFAITALRHAMYQPVFERSETAAAAPCGHRPAQLIRFAGTEPGRHNGKLHDLFLEDRHTQCARQYVLDVRAGISYRFLAIAALQIGMNHIA